MSATTTTSEPARTRWGNGLAQQEGLVGAAIVALSLVIGLVNPAFFDGENISDILVNSVFVAVAAVGMTLVIVSGGIDISVGSILGVCATVAGNLAVAGAPALLAFLAAILVGALLGSLNGALIAFARIPPIVATLGTLSILRGGLILATQGQWIMNMPPEFFISQKQFNLGGWLPIPVVVMGVVVALGCFYMRYTPGGRAIYALGGNPEAARLAGINPQRLTFRVYTLNGLLVGVAAVLYAARFTTIQANAGLGFELSVITATVVGGVSILGGSGSVIGALLGALLINVIGTGAVFLRVSPFWLQAVQGALVLLTVLIDVLRRRRTM
jgi:ribose transport system permease protein/rhamnose transport system permease protein